MKTKSNSVAPPNEYVANFDCLLQHGTNGVSANAMRRIMGKHDVTHKNRKYIMGDFIFPLKPSFKVKF